MVISGNGMTNSPLRNGLPSPFDRHLNLFWEFHTLGAEDLLDTHFRKLLCELLKSRGEPESADHRLSFDM